MTATGVTAHAVSDVLEMLEAEGWRVSRYGSIGMATDEYGNTCGVAVADSEGLLELHLEYAPGMFAETFHVDVTGGGLERVVKIISAATEAPEL